MATLSDGLAKLFSLIAVQPGGHLLKTDICFCGLGCWNWQKIGGVSVFRVCMNYCVVKGWYKEENLSLRIRKRVKHPSHASIVQAGPAAQMSNGRWVL